MNIFLTAFGRKAHASAAMFLLFFFATIAGLAQTTTVTGLSPAGPYCAGAALTVNYSVSGTFTAGNSFNAVLSNSSGSFASGTTVIGTVTNTTTGGSISATLPTTATGATTYKIQVVGTTPAGTPTASSAFTINALALNAPNAGTPLCQGTSFSVTNYLANGCLTYGSGNNFTVQLSDQTGSFAAPTSIGSGTGASITVTIPQAQTTGTLYQMRVISSNPALIGTATGNLVINSPALSAPTGLGASYCAGSTFSITNNVSTCNFFSGNTFQVQLSDVNGAFGSPTNISLAVSATTSGSISVTLPQTLATSSNYKIQVVSTNPAVTSPASAAFTINGFGISAPTISGGATSYCQGQNITLNYSVLNGCGFPTGNIFTAQLSDASGSFASPTVIGTSSTNSISGSLGNPPAGTGYRIRIVSSTPGAGVNGPDNGTDLTIGAASGTPTVFGTTGWNAYVYNSNTIAGFTNYTGYYTFSGLSFNTASQYGTSSSPTTATGYAGCTTTGATNYGISFKQTNFTCGYYQISIPYQDDESAIYINGTMVFQNTVFTSSAQNNVWTGFLGPTSTVEIRFVNVLGPGQLQITLAPVAVPVSISPASLVQCSTPTNPGVLTASSSVPLTYAWTPTTGVTPATGIGASITVAPTTTTTYTATGTDATTGCTVTGTATVTVSNVKPTVTIVATAPSVCSGISTTTLTASGATNYSWSPTTGLTPASGIGATVIANPASNTVYTVTGDNGCTGVANSNTATSSVIVQNVPGAPATSVFGNNTWNAYCNYNNITYSNYYGYYTENNLSFNTTSRWGNTAGPSVANAASGLAYSGCSFLTGTGTCGANTLNYTNYSMSFKRTNFTCGYYQIDVNYQDDSFTLLINGVQVFQNTNYTPSLQSNVWTGFLGPTSQVEMRLINNCGPGQLQVTFSPSATSPQTISPSATICAGTTTNLTASSTLTGATYSWAVSPAADITLNPNSTSANTILQTTAVTPAQNYTITNTLTDAAGTGCTATASSTLTVNPLPSTAVTPTAVSTYCPSGGTVLTASGANTYIWNPSTGLSATTGYQVTASPTVTTTYTVTGSNNCSTNNATTVITVLPLPAVSTFPSGTWNVYGFNSTTVGTNYQGYYTENGSGASGYDFNTSTRWTSGAAPSTANTTNGNAWVGCTMNATNISLSFKRTGFACGMYQINVPFHDDNFFLIINGTTVAQHVGCCDAHTNVWTGVLGPTSQVELQLVQGAGGSGLNATFTPIAVAASTNLWLGGTSTDWFTASNWCSAVPTSTTDASILAANQQFMPVIASTGAQVRNITVSGSVAATTYTNLIPQASLSTGTTNNLNVYGNWTNNGTYTANSGTVSFVGSSASSIGGSGTTTFNNLVVNDAAGVTVASGTQQVAGQMTFTSGIVTQSATLNITSTGSVAGASATSYVDGMINKIGNSAFTFPVGNGGYYAPISISAPSAVTDVFTAQYIHTTANGTYPLTQIASTLDHVSAAEYWLLNRTNGSSSVGVTLSWDSPRSGGVGNLATMHVARWDAASSKWQDQGTNGSPTGNTTTGTVISLGTVNTFSTPNSPFTLGTTTNQNTLPVELTSFACSLLPSGMARLIWTTESEFNNDYFEVQRSTDGFNFEKLGSVKGAGTTAVARNYSLNDPTPILGKSYYRLVQVDFDGKRTAYDVCLLDDQLTSPRVEVYPNPATNSVTIDYQNIGTVSGVRLFNSVGEEMTVPTAISESSIQLNTTRQNGGLYIIEIVTDKGVVKYKVIIAR